MKMCFGRDFHIVLRRKLRQGKKIGSIMEVRI